MSDKVMKACETVPEEKLLRCGNVLPLISCARRPCEAIEVVKVKYQLQWRSQDVQAIRNTWAPKKSAGTQVKRAQESLHLLQVEWV